MHKTSILVVDDDPEIRELLKLLLETRDYEVALAEDGRKAARAIAQRPFDLAMTDLLMPERDGLEFIREVHRAHPALKIIAMSGGGHIAGEAYLKMARAFGAGAVLEKPFGPEELWQAIAAVLPDRPAGAPTEVA
jgi:CheY-like chemotaxis protein